MLTLAAYQSRSQASNQFIGKADALEQLRYGFFGEIGGLLSAVKKSKRELGPKQKDSVLEELGDALWYLTTIGGEYKLTLETLGKAALVDLQCRLGVQQDRAETPIAFLEFDGLLTLCYGKLPDSKNSLLQELAAATGNLFTTEIHSIVPFELLGKLLADIIMVAAIFNLKINEIAEQNLNKIESRWPPTPSKYIELFDAEMPVHEQLPRKLSVHFVERELDGKKFVIQQIEGVNIGSRLTDNRVAPDGYRFHDVFHLSYMAHLGWSPVTRALLKYKRKSDPNKDENEDGARAMIIEEGIATWIFNHAAERDYYINVKEGRLEYGLLKQVCDMVKGYEVDKCPLWQWERAILQGFEVFRQLLNAKTGVVHINLHTHQIHFETTSTAVVAKLKSTKNIANNVLADKKFSKAKK
jgi:NTP pyrophosphatase (non-canonical NTP hydrolase)